MNIKGIKSIFSFRKINVIISYCYSSLKHTKPINNVILLSFIEVIVSNLYPLNFFWYNIISRIQNNYLQLLLFIKFKLFLLLFNLNEACVYSKYFFISI